MYNIPDNAFTHGGKFHADEVFSTAILKLLNPNLKVKRGFKVPENFDGIVYDIGFGEFDHHQKDSEIRECGVPYAAFGLIWREFGERVLQKYCPAEYLSQEAKRFDEKFIKHIDKDDNTGCGDIVADLIAGFNPSWDSTKTDNECFKTAVEFATTILQNKFNSLAAIYRANDMAKKALAEMQQGIVVLPMYAPWKMALVPSEALFAIYPSQRGGYAAQCVPNDDDTQSLKVPFPAQWRGASEQQLQQISGIQTLRFCHNSGFLITTNTVQDAIDACKLAMGIE